MAARGTGRRAAAGRGAADKPPTKAQTHTAIAAKADLTKAQVASVFDALNDVIVDSLKKHKQFTLPGLVKITVVHKPATAARPGRNPFTGENIMIKAKPAHNVVRVRALKGLKDMA